MGLTEHGAYPIAIFWKADDKLLDFGVPLAGAVEVTGFFKQQPSCHAHCEETCVPPFPPFNVVTLLCLERPSKIHSHFGSDAGMHWATTLIKGARFFFGGCDVTTCRRMAVLFWKNPVLMGYIMW